MLRAVPEPPNYNLTQTYGAIWVLECEHDSIQGSAFLLEDVGLVTCNHSLGTATKAFRFDDVSRKYPVRVLKRHHVIDLAVFSIEGTSKRLTRGDPASLNVMDHLLVASHPNYRLGDSPMIIPVHVVGFRPNSGIRRIVTNAAIVSGGSGGPVLNRRGKVIGVAVTGSRSFSRSQETEDHSIIPIDALDLL